MMYEPVAPPASRTDFVLETIRSRILSGALLPGQALVETELAASLAVSKTPVREALKTLAGSGLVVMSPYRGASVRIVDAELVRAVFEVRALVEPEAVRLAVRLAVRSGADFGPARAALADAAGETGTARLSLVNRRFHHALYAGCGNPLMIRILDDLRDQTALITVAGWGIRPTWAAEVAEHEAVLDAAERGAADRAAELMRGHITAFAGRLLEETKEDSTHGT